jgi:hypothetical protein
MKGKIWIAALLGVLGAMGPIPADAQNRRGSGPRVSHAGGHRLSHHGGQRPGRNPGHHAGHRPGHNGGNRPVHNGHHHRPGYNHGHWVRSYRWAPGGAIAAGAAIGFVSAAAAASWAAAPPEPGLCWYYTDPSRRNGFWDICP